MKKHFLAYWARKAMLAFVVTFAFCVLRLRRRLFTFYIETSFLLTTKTVNISTNIDRDIRQ